MGDRDEARRMLDYLPVLSWRGLPDGSKDFFNPDDPHRALFAFKGTA